MDGDYVEMAGGLSDEIAQAYFDARNSNRPMTQVERNRRWRERNPEKYLEQKRRYAEKRAKEKKDG